MYFNILFDMLLILLSLNVNVVVFQSDLEAKTFERVIIFTFPSKCLIFANKSVQENSPKISNENCSSLSFLLFL